MKATLPKFLMSTGSVGPLLVELDSNEAPGGTVVVTPSDAAAGGSFTPATINLTNVIRSGFFTYNPPSSGSFTISFTNNGALSNPASKIIYVPSNKYKKGQVIFSGLQANTVYRIRRLGDVADTAQVTTDANGNAFIASLQADFNYVIYGPNKFRRQITLNRENVVVEPNNDDNYLQILGYPNTQYRVDPVGHKALTQFLTTNSVGVVGMFTKRDHAYRIKLGSHKRVVLMDQSKSIAMPV